MVRAVRGVLITVDPAIKAIILDIDRDNHEFVIEDLDETHLLITENMHDLLKKKLDDRLKETQQDEEESSSA